MRQSVLLLACTCLQVVGIGLFAQVWSLGLDPVTTALLGLGTLGFGSYWWWEVLKMD